MKEEYEFQALELSNFSIIGTLKDNNKIKEQINNM